MALGFYTPLDRFDTLVWGIFVLLCLNFVMLMPILSVLDTVHGFKLFGFKAKIKIYKWCLNCREILI